MIRAMVQQHGVLVLLWTALVLLPAASEAQPAEACVPDEHTLCLLDGRFAVTMEGTTPQGDDVRALAERQTADTGLFYYFLPSTLEATVKIVDGRVLNDKLWVFYASLSNIEFSIRVEDTTTGEWRLYSNPQDVFASVGDTEAFPLEPGEPNERVSPPSFPGSLQVASLPAGPGPGDGLASYPCPDDGVTLCLLDGRFHVRASWEDFQGGHGVGRPRYVEPRPTLDESGFFWFFHPDNLELGIKLLDGRTVNGRFWFFYGAMSNVAYQIEVEDTATGTRQIYTNPSGVFGSRGDTNALAGRQCQGIAGLQCPEHESCSLPDDMCTTADLAGVCVASPTCLDIPAEVCGCNGQTYLNDCHLLLAGVGKDHDGPC
jgi:hypothetical protein